MLENILIACESAIALCGVFVLLYSSLKAVYLFFKGITGTSININKIRSELGYGIVLALEFTVAADIIGSIAKPNYYDIGMLAALVLIRTFLSYFLNKELESLGSEHRQNIQDLSQ